MTKQQRRHHKMGNALRRENILKRSNSSTGNPDTAGQWALLKVGQRSKYSTI